MSFQLLQEYCTCPTEKALVCCPESWHIIFEGSRFCTNAECWYAPKEVKATAIAWALEKCHIFTMGCSNIVVVTDYQPLTGIFEDRDLSKIHNPCLFKLKEKLLRYIFTIQHCPGNWYKGANSISRNPVALLSILSTHALLQGHPVLGQYRCYNGISNPSSDNELWWQ